MITLVTGTPGAGKSLYTIFFLKAKAEKENRQVYYHGIKDLNIPEWQSLDDPKKWYETPHGSIIIIDECQSTFRPRPIGSTVPKHESEFETHRHNGHDVYLITQHPNLLSSHVRKLVGQHLHVKRKFGTNAATIHEWSEVNQDPSKTRADSIRHDFKYPKEAFNLYKSAEIHTVKRNIPMRIYLMFLVPITLILIVYLFFTSDFYTSDDIQEIQTDQDNLTSQGVITKATNKPYVEKLTYLEARKPQIDDFPHTAPVYVELTEPVIAPYPAACVQIRGKCQCWTQQGTKLQTSEPVCLQIVKTGFFIDWSQPNQNNANGGVIRGTRSPDADQRYHASN